MTETVIKINSIFDYIDTYGSGTTVFKSKERMFFVNHHDKEQLFTIAWMKANKIHSTLMEEERFFKMLNTGKYLKVNN